jgi:putative SOS response-associated peptidase YedK
MCFSVNVNLVREELEHRYGATLIDPDKYRPSYYYHAFAMPELPVVCPGNPQVILHKTWGLIPSHCRDRAEAESIRSKTFNARAESIAAKSSFSSSFTSKRCIVPVSGFFEWQHIAGEKIPWYIYDSAGRILSLAGLYDRWTETRTGEVIDTFTIITTEANELLASIHNSKKRMPAVLDSDSEKLWLDQSASQDDLISCLKPLSSDMFKAHTISPLVSSKTANKNTPDLISPYQYNTQQTLF